MTLRPSDAPDGDEQAEHGGWQQSEAEPEDFGGVTGGQIQVVAGQAAGGDADEIIAIEQPAEAGRDEVVSDGINAGGFAIGIDEGGISDDDQARSGGAEALGLLGATFNGGHEDERGGGAGIGLVATRGGVIRA